MARPQVAKRANQVLVGLELFPNVCEVFLGLQVGITTDDDELLCTQRTFNDRLLNRGNRAFCGFAEAHHEDTSDCLVFEGIKKVEVERCRRQGLVVVEQEPIQARHRHLAWMHQPRLYRVHRRLHFHRTALHRLYLLPSLR